MRFLIILSLVFNGFCGLLNASAPKAFLSQARELRLNEVVFLPFSVDSKSSDDQTFHATVVDPQSVKITHPAKVLKGETLGFIGLRADRPGKTKLSIGQCSIVLSVSKQLPLSLSEDTKPRFTTPSSSSLLTAKSVIAAEIWVGSASINRQKEPKAELLLPNGKTLKAKELFPPIDGPFWRLVFDVDAAQLPEGTQEFVIRCQLPLMNGQWTEWLVSSPHRLLVQKQVPIADAGECEDRLGLPRTYKSLGEEAPGIGFDSSASSAKFISLPGYRPEWLFESTIAEPGVYQLYLISRGNLGASAYPSLELIEPESGRQLTYGRIASTQWQRHAVGRPISLKSGKNPIAIRVSNQMNYRNKINRSCELDRFEWVKVQEPSSPTGTSSMMMAASMDSMKEAASMNASQMDKAAPMAKVLRVSFIHPLAHLAPTGKLRISALLDSPSLKKDSDYRHLTTTLLINDKIVETKQGERQVDFDVEAFHWKNGKNRLQLISDAPGGTQAKSEIIEMPLDAKHPPLKPGPIGHHEEHLHANHPLWKGLPVHSLDKRPEFKGPDAPAHLHLSQTQKPSVLRLTLPHHLEGNLRLRLKSFASIPQSKAAELFLIQGKSSLKHSIGHLQAKPAWTWNEFNHCQLEKGPKFLEIHFTANEFPIAIGDFSAGKPYFIDQTPPEIRIDYPKANAKVSILGDAIVATCFDDTAPTHAKLEIDGKPWGLVLPMSAPAGQQLFPLSLKGLSLGRHQLEVILADASGKETRSGKRPIEVVADDRPQLDLPYPRAVRLTEKLALGADPASLCQILTQGEDVWLKNQLNAEDGLAPTHQTRFQNYNDYDLRGRVVQQLLDTSSPVRAHFCQWIENHFSTWIAKTQPDAKNREHKAFATAGITHFSDLLLISATSPAMMIYLDQQSSANKQLNENYARELLELHSLGVDAGYSQQDVTQLAHLLTGWGAQNEASMSGFNMSHDFRFSPQLHDFSSYRLFGWDFERPALAENADLQILEVIQWLSSHPATAKHLCQKLADHYLGTEQCRPQTLQALIDTYHQSGGNFAKILQTLVKSEDFMRRNLEMQILQPIEFGIATQRRLRSSHPWRVLALGESSGRHLYDRTSPDGYPEENQEYADSNFQLQKWRFVSEASREEWVHRLPMSWFEGDTFKQPAHRQQVIDTGSLLFLKKPLSESSKKALEQLLTQAPESKDERRLLFASFLMMLPEAQTH